jgi:ABC-type branched-subunit amino acid transport system substrate-binding protein
LPTQSGWPWRHVIRINTFAAPTCGEPVTAGTAAATAAARIAANLQNVAVLGPICSFGFAQALTIYQRARLVTLSGSATNASLPAPGLTVFDRTVVSDDQDDGSWYTTVSQLPSDLAWQQVYTARFGTAPSAYADLYYDAASLAIDDLKSVSRIDAHQDVIINRPALAHAVRMTTDYVGVSCTITLDPATGDRLNDPAALSRCAGSTG